MAEILLVEDDADIAFAVNAGLTRAGYTAHRARTLAQAKAAFDASRPDLILLDYNLPDGPGDDFCRWVKARADTPVIFLTVRDEEADIVRGLDLGADDYIVKPFSLAVLLSRVAAVLRRAVPGHTADGWLHCGVLALDPAATKAYREGREIALTAQEYRLFAVLMENKNQTLTRARLLEKLWDADGNFVSDNTLTVTMKRLREKLGRPSYIQTLRGIGYRLEEPV